MNAITTYSTKMTQDERVQSFPTEWVGADIMRIHNTVLIELIQKALRDSKKKTAREFLRKLGKEKNPA